MQDSKGGIRVTSPDDVFVSLQRLRTNWPGRGWSWDSRFTCVASTISIEVVTHAREAVALAMPHLWTERTLSTAPKNIREVVESTGGIREQQAIVAGDPGGGVTAFGLWWPWRDGQTISMRVGLVGRVGPGELIALSELFGAQM